MNLLSFRTAKRHTLATLTGLIGFINTLKIEAYNKAGESYREGTPDSPECMYHRGKFNAYNDIVKQIRNIVEEVEKYKL